jgi:hypothetical protein
LNHPQTRQPTRTDSLNSHAQPSRDDVSLFISRIWPLYAIGGALCTGLFLLRD